MVQIATLFAKTLVTSTPPPSSSSMSAPTRGVWAAVGAYICWGVFPLYFHAVAAVPPLEMVAHRIAWSLVFILGILAWQNHWSWLRSAWRSPRTLGLFTLSAVTLAFNWLVYIWAVQHGHVLEGSLGYFINPLVNVMIGAVFLKERLRSWQWGAVAIAALGVLWLTWTTGRLPWIALALALSFAAYGYQRKKAPLGALEGLTLETFILSPIAIAALVWWSLQHQAVFVTQSLSLTWWVMAAGPVTAIPLIMFAYGARRIPFSLLGLLQYIGPTLQLMCGIWILGEPFEGSRVIGFVIIWLALLVYSAESWWHHRTTSSTPTP